MKSTSIALRLAVLASLLHGTSNAQGQEELVRSYIDVDSVVVGQRFTLIVVAEHHEETMTSFTRMFPDTANAVRQFGDLLILRELGRGRSRGAEGIVHDSTLVEATTFAIDTAAVGPIPIVFVRGSDSTFAFTDPFVIPVASVLDPDASDIRDLAPIAEFRSPVLLWLLFTTALILAMAAFIYWYRRRPELVFLGQEREAVRLEPAEDARIRLRHLADFNIDSDKAAETFCVELADILRTYLSRRTSVHALEMTTSEVRDDLERLVAENAVPPETPQDTASVLDVCDLAKFAEIFPDREACAHQLESTERIVVRIEDHLSPAELEATEDSGDEAPDLQHA